MSLRIFDRYDVDGSGQLERHELMKALTRNAHAAPDFHDLDGIRDVFFHMPSGHLT